MSLKLGCLFEGRDISEAVGVLLEELRHAGLRRPKVN